MDLEVYTKIFVYIILIIMDFLNRYPYDLHHHNETATLRTLDRGGSTKHTIIFLALRRMVG